MAFAELSNEQRRQFIDAKQAFEAWRAADRDFRHSYRGTMRWVSVSGAQYLYRITGAVRNSLGRRSPETERIKTEYTEQRERLRGRRNRTAARIKDMDRVNRAHGLGRMPTIAAKVLRIMDEAGLLGQQLFLVGTHSLYAYEARAGVRFDGGLTATTDLDLLIDVRRHMSFAVAEDVRPQGIMGLLRKADRSFSRTAEFRATNDEGYFVDLIAPMRPDEVSATAIRLGDSNDDLAAAAILGLQWLINAPKFEEVVIGEDGRPLWVSCIDPRALALHKYWVSRQNSREPTKRRRDANQAQALALLAADYLGLDFKAKDLTALPIEMTRAAKDLVAAARKERE